MYRHENKKVKEWQDKHNYVQYPDKVCDRCDHVEFRLNREESNSTQPFCTLGKFWTNSEATCDEFTEEETCPECGSDNFDGDFCQSCHDTELITNMGR